MQAICIVNDYLYIMDSCAVSNGHIGDTPPNGGGHHITTGFHITLSNCENMEKVRPLVTVVSRKQMLQIKKTTGLETLTIVFFAPLLLYHTRPYTQRSTHPTAYMYTKLLCALHYRK